MVDEITLFLAPIIVGGGLRALPDGYRAPLELVEERRFGGGFVMLRYRPTLSAGPAQPKSMRITTRRMPGRLTSRKPAASNTSLKPTCSSPQVTSSPGCGDRSGRPRWPGRPGAGVLDRRRRQGSADTLPPVAGADHEAGDRPDACVGLVLGPALPRGPIHAQEADVGRSGLDRAPADRLAVEVRHESAGGGGGRVAGMGLGAHARGAFLGWVRLERLPGRELVALAPAHGADAARAEDRRDVLPAGLVGRHDPMGPSIAR